MRTTLTLDDDVAAMLRASQAKSKMPLKKIVNETLRRGLALSGEQAARKPFRTKGFHLGPSLIGSLDNIGDVLDRLEAAENDDRH